ncbi:uncharacterized protein Gasu_51040 [Galdieria sulphuraria]|uniref:Uncharacterized protein n=1 Tax=Galdieria sulphuraria TaxID=130081 RepID=M2XUS4_GALSU|nr:uncharacterized protein Gasu_51040 [Galdieria sulphuraria]EME27378.1 hypothetical protein Gasu_51040 [Galdieria sulphuraria]|eukprot:XP_005703898.1 hypothetical protein Gasu_51040 [Galdieria sulphuraria]
MFLVYFLNIFLIIRFLLLRGLRKLSFSLFVPCFVSSKTDKHLTSVLFSVPFRVPVIYGERNKTGKILG